MKKHKEAGDKAMEGSESMNTMMSEKEIPNHEVESAAHDLMRAEMHKINHPLMAKVHAHLAKKKAAITSIQDIKDARDSMAMEKKSKV